MTKRTRLDLIEGFLQTQFFTVGGGVSSLLLLHAPIFSNIVILSPGNLPRNSGGTANDIKDRLILTMIASVSIAIHLSNV